MDRDERIDVLRMLEQGEISAEEAAVRLAGQPIGVPDVPDVPDVAEVQAPMPAVALRPQGRPSPAREPAPVPNAPERSDGGASRWLRVRVTDARSGRRKVSVNIPMALVDFGLRMGSRFAPEVSGVDLGELRDAIQSGANGKLVEVYDDEDGEHIVISVD